MIAVIGLIFISAGLLFDLVGCVGLIRMPDMYSRLQASTKCAVLGTCLILFGTFIIVGPQASGIKSLICMVFVLITAPVSAHAIARGAYKAGFRLSDKSVTDEYGKKAKKT